MSYKLNIRSNSSTWTNVLKDLYIELDNTNWSSENLYDFLDEVNTALDGKESRNVVKIITNYTATSHDVVLVDTTSGPITVTLPTSPVRGDKIKVIDVAGFCATNPITISRNGYNINADTQDVIMDIDFNSIIVEYDTVGTGWHLDIFGGAGGSNTSDITDPFITLNSDVVSGTPTENCGIIVSRGDENNAIIQYNETTNTWQLTNDGLGYHDILTTGNISSLISHADLDNLDADDHTQYVHTSTDRTISATHTFNPDSVGEPFSIGVNAQKQMVSGLNSNYTNGLLVSSQNSSPGDISKNDIWIQETT